MRSLSLIPIIAWGLAGSALASPELLETHCSKCHSWVFSDSEPFPDVMFIPCGTLNDTPEREIDYHVFYGERAGWIEVNDGKPKYDEMLPTEELARWVP